jgi:hypothetical protein
MLPGPDLGQCVGGSAASGEHGLHMTTSSNVGVGVTLGVGGTAWVVTGAEGASNVAGAREGTERAETGLGAVVQACTSQLAWLCFF